MLRQLRELNEKKRGRFDIIRYCLYAAGATALFTLVYGGGLFDCAVALVCGAAVQLMAASFSRINIFPFAISLIGSIFIAALTVATVTLTGMGNIDKIIVGAIIPLLPGLAMTNAIRDIIMGDLVSGSARITEALLSAAGIAVGVGLVFGVFVGFGGVL